MVWEIKFAVPSAVNKNKLPATILWEIVAILESIENSRKKKMENHDIPGTRMFSGDFVWMVITSGRNLGINPAFGYSATIASSFIIEQ